MRKFKAPEHATGVFIGGFEVRADEDGIAELPEGAGGNVVQAMLAAGWTVHKGRHAPKPATSSEAPPSDA